jgi:hypothetical protein
MLSVVMDLEREEVQAAAPQLQSLRTPASWVIVDRSSGRPVLETFSKAIAAKVNRASYEVLSILEWLQRVNVAAKTSTK